MGAQSTAYPIFLNLEGKPCLVVGGGAVGERKALGLAESGANVTVVSPEMTERLKAEDRVNRVDRNFDAADLDGQVLVFAATDSEQVNGHVVEVSRARGIWVNDATSADRSDFILPATVRRGGLTIAISTQGGSPAYAKLLKEMLESEFGDEHAEMVALLADLRPRVRATLASPADRRNFWDRVVTEETLSLIKCGKMDIVTERIEQWLSS
jgi:precorrin-2 dehydrogenase/sirohydrochlorin ferrochelatase